MKLAAFEAIAAALRDEQLANRPRDLDDIEHLRIIIEEKTPR